MREAARQHRDRKLPRGAGVTGNAKFSMHAAKTVELFADLVRRPFVDTSSPGIPKDPAIYVFYHDNMPVHVGRTRNLRQRLRGHISMSHYSASFAFKRARAVTGMVATYKKGEGRGKLMEDPTFKAAFDRALAEVKGMSIRYLLVEDPIDQYLLELYAALELGTSLSEFDTH